MRTKFSCRPAGLVLPPALLLVVVAAALLLCLQAPGARQRAAARAATSNSTKYKTLNPLLVSPTPREYVDLYKFACGLSNDSSRQLATKSQLVERYAASGNARLMELVQRWNVQRQCRREMTAWRYGYIDESDSVSIRERSVDERSANVVYMTRAIKGLSIDIFSYNWGDSRTDEENKRRVAGPKVDERLCGVQLRQMLAISADLGARVALMRSLQAKLNSSAAAENEATTLTDQHLSLAKILDSYGRYDSGRLYGKIFSQGSYYQCISNRLTLEPGHKVPMRFCWAHLTYDRILDESLLRRVRGRFEDQINVLYSAVCIPESCHSLSFPKYKRELQALIDTQFVQPQMMYIERNMELASLYCLVDEDSDFVIPLAGKLLIGFLVGWCALTFAVTYWRAKRRRQAKISAATSGQRAAWSKRNGSELSIVQSLDLIESWKDFVTPNSNSNKIRAVQLDAINFIKVLGCAFVVLGHTMILLAGHAADEVRTSRVAELDPVISAMCAGTLVVDTFFVITGILWAYFTLKRLRKRELESGHIETNLELRQLQLESAANHKLSGDRCEPECGIQLTGGSNSTNNNHGSPLTLKRVESWPETIKEFCVRWFYYSLFRWLRVVPLYAIVHWFKKFVFIYLGKGPFWDHGLNHNTLNGACHKESFLTPLTFLAAYYPLSKQCTLQSWSIANDIFFAILAPPIILLIKSRFRLAIHLSLMMCMVNYAWAQYQFSQVPQYLDEELRELRSFGFYRFFDEISVFYTAPHLRILCFLTGVWGGYCLFHKQLEIDTRRARDQTGAGGPLLEVHVDFGAAGDKKQLVSDKIEWPAWLRGWATNCSAGYILIVFLGFAYNSDILKPYFDPIYRQIYRQFLSSMRVLWSLANAVLFLRMMTDWKDNIWMRWSAGKFWQIFIKLNYAILLLHMDLLIYTIDMSTSMPNNFTKWSFFNLGAGIFMFSIPLAVFAYVVFENPIDKLTRSRLPRY